MSLGVEGRWKKRCVRFTHKNQIISFDQRAHKWGDAGGKLKATSGTSPRIFNTFTMAGFKK